MVLEIRETEARTGGLGMEGDMTYHMAFCNASQITRRPIPLDFLFMGIRENLFHRYENSAKIEEILNQHLFVMDEGFTQLLQ